VSCLLALPRYRPTVSTYAGWYNSLFDRVIQISGGGASGHHALETPLPFLAECVGDAADGAGGVNQHDIETNAGAAPLGMRGEQDFGGTEQACALARRERPGGAGERGAAFHLDERGEAVAFGDRIHLARFGADAPREHGPAVTLQRGAGERLGVDAAGVRAAAAQRPAGPRRRGQSAAAASGV